ncbi:MAG: ISAs1 family transposase [Spirochaetaceae bacterium]|jgi:hypothetical protein|nr:ISAs1 family transposase [Spirochaetaceae bacterium]
MEQEKQAALMPLMTCFSVIQDPRIERNKLYPLYEVIVITIPALIALDRRREDTERYAKAKKARPGRFLKPEHGIPHHDVYRRMISRIAPEKTGGCFMNWVRAVKREYGREDGPGALQGRGKAPRIVSAWAAENRPVFGQVKTEEKSKGNEVSTITAIPALLGKLAPEGCIVTIDAMGCQYNIAVHSAEKKADYLFSLKGSRGTPQEDVKKYFAGPDFSAPADANHIPFQPVPARDERPGRTRETKSGMIGRRKQMAWPNEYLERLLFQSSLRLRFRVIYMRLPCGGSL